MKNTAQIKLEVNIDANKRTVKINGKTIIDGKQIIDYDKDIAESKDADELKKNSVFLDEVLNMLTKPVEVDARFKGTTGIK